MELANLSQKVAVIFAIQHFCLHDGPGTRSLVFFSGCPLRCTWCCNPESWERGPQLAYKAQRCLECGACTRACTRGAMARPGKWDERGCDLCGECVNVCPAEAIVRFGDRFELAKVREVLRPEYGIYRRSGGGVTFSGGEATLSAAFAARLANTLHADGVHVTLETCGLFQLGPAARPSSAAKLLQAVDLVLFDLKLFEDEAHIRHCGAGNQSIKQNLRTLADLQGKQNWPRLWPRMPLVPGLTTTEANLAGWAGTLRDVGLSRLTLVPYHALGAGKRQWLVQVPPAPQIPPLEQGGITRCRESLLGHGIETFLPGEEPWGE